MRVSRGCIEVTEAVGIYIGPVVGTGQPSHQSQIGAVAWRVSWNKSLRCLTQRGSEKRDMEPVFLLVAWMTQNPP